MKYYHENLVHVKITRITSKHWRCRIVVNCTRLESVIPLGCVGSNPTTSASELCFAKD